MTVTQLESKMIDEEQFCLDGEDNIMNVDDDSENEDPNINDEFDILKQIESEVKNFMDEHKEVGIASKTTAYDSNNTKFNLKKSTGNDLLYESKNSCRFSNINAMNHNNLSDKTFQINAINAPRKIKKENNGDYINFGPSLDEQLKYKELMKNFVNTCSNEVILCSNNKKKEIKDELLNIDYDELEKIIQDHL